MRHVAALLACLLLAPLSADAQEGTVPVYVDMDDKEMSASRIQSYVRNGLRELPNVEVVGKREKASCVIDLFMMDLQNKRGVTTGHVISVLFVSDVNDTLFDLALREAADTIPDSTRHHLRVIYEIRAQGATRIRSRFLLTGSEDDLRSSSSTIVADFDNDIMESYRQAMREIER